MNYNNLLYVQYGCGHSAANGWRNFDASPSLRLERLPLLGRLYNKNKSRFPLNVEYGDILKGLPLSSNSCEAVYCSHVLEHLSLEGFRTALKNTFKILRPGGTFRLVMPDLEHCAKKYLTDSSKEASLVFMKETDLGCERRVTSPKDLIVSLLGNSRHLWMWDFKSVSFELQKVGFFNIRRAEYGDAADTIFRQVEVKDRWDTCLGIECNK